LRRRPVETPPDLLVGYKLAHLMLASDGSRAEFCGVSLGAHRPYGPIADASCVFSRRHRPPNPFCDCGFYCLHSADAARAVGCDGRYRGAVLLEVVVSGRFVRYDYGLRYARQRVRAVRVGLCGCGRRANAMADSGWGQVGWRRLVPVCAWCARQRPRASFDRLTALLDGRVPVTSDDAAAPIDAPQPVRADERVAVLTAEVALLQARLDDVQTRLRDVGDPR
jgi:hypothetical protein